MVHAHFLLIAHQPHLRVLPGTASLHDPPRLRRRERLVGRLSEVDAHLVAQAPQVFKILSKLARHVRKVAPAGLRISEWSQIGADAIDLVDGLRVKQAESSVTRGL
jgi:hypothetical protein